MFLNILFGIVYGLGFGLIIPSQPLLLNQCLEKFRATACGICFSGAALSSMLFPFLSEKLLDEYGLNGTLLVFGALVFNILVGASLLSFSSTSCSYAKLVNIRVSSTESDMLLREGALKVSTQRSSVAVVTPAPSIGQMSRELLTDSLFYFTAFSSSTGLLGCFTFAMVFVGFEIRGSSCSGWVSDSGLIKRKNVVLLAASISGFVLCAFPFVKTPALIFILTGLYGLLVGSQIIIYYVLLAYYIEAHKLPLGVSLAFSFGGMLSLFRPSVVGLIRDNLGRYDELFYILGILSMMGGFIWLLEPYVLDFRSRKLQNLLHQEQRD